jgi:hypothetical protein
MAVAGSQNIAGGISIDVALSPAELAKVQAMLKLVEPKLRRSLSRDLHKSLRPVAEKIDSDFPSAPMSGLASRWGRITTKVGVDFNGPPNKALARFIVKAEPGFERLFAITERAGSRTRGYTPQGMKLISNSRGGLQERFPLEGKGGRFAFASFFKQRVDVAKKVRDAVDRFIDKFNKGA